MVITRDEVRVTTAPRVAGADTEPANRAMAVRERSADSSEAKKRDEQQGCEHCFHTRTHRASHTSRQAGNHRRQ